jgi:hypothetical protein
LRAAVNHHAKEGLHRGVVRVVLPERGKARQRWLTRDEAAKLLWICCESNPGRQTDGETPAAPSLPVLAAWALYRIAARRRPTAAWERGPGLSHVDLGRRLFHRHADGKVETGKRQPSVKLAPRLAAHLARWHRIDGGRGHVVRFAGLPILSVKTAMGTAAKLAIRRRHRLNPTPHGRDVAGFARRAGMGGRRVPRDIGGDD